MKLCIHTTDLKTTNFSRKTMHFGVDQLMWYIQYFYLVLCTLLVYFTAHYLKYQQVYQCKLHQASACGQRNAQN